MSAVFLHHIVRWPRHAKQINELKNKLTNSKTNQQTKKQINKLKNKLTDQKTHSQIEKQIHKPKNTFTE